MRSEGRSAEWKLRKGVDRQIERKDRHNTDKNTIKYRHLREKMFGLFYNL